jgi:hypothetical protein
MAVAVIAATIGGYSFRGGGTTSDESQRINHQLELAQSCLDAGILDCAAHLAEPIVRADPNNNQAKEIDEAVKKRQASPIQTPPVSDQQEIEALLELARANVDYGQKCLSVGNFSCAITLSDLVLKILPLDFVAGQQVRTDAQTLSNHAHLKR